MNSLLLDQATAARVRTRTSAVGFQLDHKALRDECAEWLISASELAVQLGDEWEILNPRSRVEVALALDLEPGDSQASRVLKELPEPGPTLAEWRRYDRLFRMGSRLFQRIADAHGHLPWRYNLTDVRRYVPTDYGVGVLPDEIRRFVQPRRGKLVHLVYPKLEAALWCGVGDQALAYNMDVYGDDCLPWLYGMGQSPVIVWRSGEDYFPGLSVSNAMDAKVVLSAEENLTTLCGRACCPERVLDPGYGPITQFTHGSCQDILDSVAVRLFRGFDGQVDIVLVDHHSILLDVPEDYDCGSDEVFMQRVEIAVGEVSALPTILTGDNWAEVSASRGDDPRLYGYLP